MKTFFVQKARFGTREYYVGRMYAGELVDNVGIISELPEWQEFSAGAKESSQVNLKDVAERYMPALLSGQTRFMPGIVAVIRKYGKNGPVFEDLKEHIESPAIKNLMLGVNAGILTLYSTDSITAIYGQEIIAALRLCIRGQNGLSVSMMDKCSSGYIKKDSLLPHPELRGEEFPIVLIPENDIDEIVKIRDDILQYRKTSYNIEEKNTRRNDIWTQIAYRQLDTSGCFKPVNGVQIVNVKNSTISARSRHLTTLRVLARVSEVLCQDMPVDPADKNSVHKASKISNDYWNAVFSELDDYKEYFRRLLCKEAISPLRKKTLLLHPLPQIALAYAVMTITEKRRVSYSEAVRLLNRLDWDPSLPIWEGIIVDENGRSLKHRSNGARNAGRKIAEMVMGERQ